MFVVLFFGCVGKILKNFLNLSESNLFLNGEQFTDENVQYGAAKKFQRVVTTVIGGGIFADNGQQLGNNNFALSEDRR